MSGMRLGRLSLRADAVYCAVSALIVCALAPVLAPHVGVSWAAVAAVGAGVGAWAAFLWWATDRFPLRRMLQAVLAVNVVAAAAVAASAPLLSSVLLTIVLVAVAIEVAGFAASQALALRRFAA